MADVIEDLIVRLTGEGSQYKKMMDTAAATTKAAATTVQAATKTFDQFHQNLQSAVGTVTSYIASWSAFSQLSGMFSLFEKQEETEIRLTAAVKSHGMEITSTLKVLKEYAAQVASTTTHTAGEVLQLEKAAIAYGLIGGHITNAVGQALALSEATGIGAESALRMTQAMESGDIKKAQAFARMIKELRGVRDQTEFVKKYNDLVSQGLETQEKLAESAGGQITRLGNAWVALQKDLGAVVAKVIEPLVQGVQQVVKWFKDLSPAVKESIVVVAGVAAGVVALTAAIATAGIVFNVAFGGSGYLVGIIVTALVGAAAGAAMLVQDLGGVGKAMDYIKDAALRAWDWLLPVRQALGSLWAQIVVSSREAWSYVKTIAASAWAYIAGTTKTTWDDIRGYIVDAILFAEFTLTHFKEVSDLVWAGMKYGAVAFVGEWKYLWETVVPTGVNWIKDNWPVIWKAVMDYTVLALHMTVTVWKTLIANSGIEDTINAPFKAAFKLVWENAGAIIRNLGKAATMGYLFDALWQGSGRARKGALDIEAELKKIPEIANDAFSKLKPFVLPARVEGDLERKLREEFERQKEAMFGAGGSFTEFRKKKLEEWAKAGVIPDPKKEAVDKFGPAGAAAGKAFKAGMDTVDFALSGSFEALKNLEEYATKLAEAREKAGAHGGAGMGMGEEDIGGGGAGGYSSPVAAAGPALGGVETVADKLLRDILGVLVDIKGMKGGVLKPVDVTGSSSFAV